MHGLESLQVIAEPAHDPPLQTSPVVHALPSSQDAVLFAYTQPVAGLHESSVHGFESLQTTGVPGLHTPPPQTSPVVQALPSSQDAALLTYTQPEAGLHESSVHGFESLQTTGAPGTQAPPAHASPVVQALPSSHDALLFA